MTTLYVLKCEHNKYYIGKTERPLYSRIEEHFLKNGSEWTKVHKPVSILEVHDNVHSMDEDKFTKIYMAKYGIENVRGGSYSSIVLPEYKVKALVDELCTATNACFKCHKTGHFAKDCVQKKSIRHKCQYCAVSCTSQEHLQEHEKFCHKKPWKGIFKDLTGVLVGIVAGASEVLSEWNDESSHDRCYRCGRQGHFARTCYASTDVNGKWL